MASVRCVVHGMGNQWEGLCLDLDIAVQGNSLADVKNRLNNAVHTYVEDALAENEPHRSRLLGRKAPLRVRLFWAVALFLATLSKRSDRDSAESFAVPCPA